jgi:hypothetical protein
MASTFVEVAEKPKGFAMTNHPTATDRLEEVKAPGMSTLKSGLNGCDSIPLKKATRPNTICGPLHIQCGASGGDKYFRELITEVLAWPRVECTPPMGRSPDLVSIHLKPVEPAIASSTTSSVRRFAQVYLPAPTIVLTLPLVAAHWAIVRGWAEPHYLASHGLMPAGTVLLYVPTDEIEREVCRFHFSRAYEYCRDVTGGETGLCQKELLISAPLSLGG